jgi:ADP-glucose pyrophosphorylase
MVKKAKTMKHLFEHKTHQILPFNKFITRLIKYFLFSCFLIAFSLAIGTVGYYYFAHISWIDSFYNASLILTGMGPVNEMPTDSAKLFASFYALFSGIAFLSTVAVIFAPIAHRLLHILHINEDEN